MNIIDKFEKMIEAKTQEITNRRESGAVDRERLERLERVAENIAIQRKVTGHELRELSMLGFRVGVPVPVAPPEGRKLLDPLSDTFSEDVRRELLLYGDCYTNQFYRVNGNSEGEKE